MKQPDLRGLSRAELLEMLVQQAEEKDRLEQELEDCRRQLEEKKLALSKAGSIAEAALQVSGVFEATQAACDQYKESIEALAAQQQEWTEQASQLLQQTKTQCEVMKAQTKEQCQQMVEKAKKESLRYWTKVSRKLEEK